METVNTVKSRELSSFSQSGASGFKGVSDFVLWFGTFSESLISLSSRTSVSSGFDSNMCSATLEGSKKIGSMVVVVEHSTVPEADWSHCYSQGTRNCSRYNYSSG